MKSNIKKKLKEWIKRYWLSELISYFLAMCFGYSTFKITNNYYLAWASIIIWDYLWYFWVMIIKEIKTTYEKNNKYSIKLFWKDLRNLWIEFWPPQILEIFIIYPILTFYIPPLFKNYVIWWFIAMTLAVIIFYIQTIILYEIRNKYLTKK